MPQEEPGGATNQALVESLMAALGISRQRATQLLQQAQANGLSGQNAVEWAIRRWNNQQGGGGGDGDGVPVITDGGDGSGGGSGSGGSSAVGSTGPDPAALRASYIGLLHSWKMNPKDVAGLVDRAVNNEWTTQQFVNALRQTKAYKQQFVGIRSTNLSESAYNTKFFDYRDAAKDIGRGLTRQQFGTLLKKGVDGAEWRFRIAAADAIKRNGALFNWYERELRRRGMMKGNKQLSYGEMWKIVTKQGSQQFERIYETAFLQQNLAKIGFDLRGAGRDITRKDLLRLIKQFETGTPGAEVEKLGASDFAQLADEVENLIPLSHLQGAGVTKRDLLEMKLGGPRAKEIAEKVNQLKASLNLKNEGQALPQLQQAGDKKTRLVVGGLSGEAGY